MEDRLMGKHKKGRQTDGQTIEGCGGFPMLRQTEQKK